MCAVRPPPQVRSTNLDTWHPEWIESMKKGGNKKCNDLWEAQLPANFVKPDVRL